MCGLERTQRIGYRHLSPIFRLAYETGDDYPHVKLFVNACSTFTANCLEIVRLMLTKAVRASTAIGRERRQKAPDKSSLPRAQSYSQ